MLLVVVCNVGRVTLQAAWLRLLMKGGEQGPACKPPCASAAMRQLLQVLVRWLPAPEDSSMSPYAQ